MNWVAFLFTHIGYCGSSGGGNERCGAGERRGRLGIRGMT